MPKMCCHVIVSCGIKSSGLRPQSSSYTIYYRPATIWEDPQIQQSPTVVSPYTITEQEKCTMSRKSQGRVVVIS